MTQTFSESFVDAWKARYGIDPPSEMPNLTNFLRHRSVRKYSDRAIDEQTITTLVACAQSSATSSNLQLWSIVSVQEPARREAIARLCADQDQIRSAAWFFAFLADHHRLRRASEQAGIDPAGLDYVEFYTMAVIDAALAAERMVCAAESLGMGICYIGALRNDPEGVRKLLDLPIGTFGVFGLCLGWPAEEPTETIKPRLLQDSIWFRERYLTDVDVSNYNNRMREFYLSEGMRAEYTWAQRSGRRANQLTGREVLKNWLESQGFNLR
jgi:nitroreductase